MMTIAFLPTGRVFRRERAGDPGRGNPGSSKVVPQMTAKATNRMAHLWFSDNAGSWVSRPLGGAGCFVRFTPDGPEFNPPAEDRRHPAAILIRPSLTAGSDEWSLLAAAAAGVRVNGTELVLGMRALRDKDDVSVGGQHLFFSTEQLASVAPFVGLAQPAFCPRCKQGLERGVPAVQCPRCRAWHHHTETLPCWTYDETCALCQQQPTALDAGYAWTPENL